MEISPRRKGNKSGEKRRKRKNHPHQRGHGGYVVYAQITYEDILSLYTWPKMYRMLFWRIKCLKSTKNIYMAVIEDIAPPKRINRLWTPKFAGI